MFIALQLIHDSLHRTQESCQIEQIFELTLCRREIKAKKNFGSLIRHSRGAVSELRLATDSQPSRVQAG